MEKHIVSSVVTHLQEQLMTIESQHVRLRITCGTITSEAGVFASSSAKYIFRRELTNELLQNIRIVPWTEVDWRVGVHSAAEIDISVTYQFAEIHHNIQRVSENEFEVRYRYVADVEMKKEHCHHFLNDVAHIPQVQALIFSFVVNGEELVPDEHEDLFLKWADFTLIQDMSLSAV